MALREISGRQDDAAGQVVEIYERTQREWVTSLVDQLKAVASDGDLSDIDRVKVPDDLRYRAAPEIVEIADEVFDFGRRTVQEEQTRQARRAKAVAAMAFRDEPPESAEIKKLFWVRSRQMLNRLSSRSEAIAAEWALGIYRTVGEDVRDADFGEVGADLTGMFMNVVKLEARALISEAFNLGRDRQAAAIKERVEKAVYSAILDENLCEECRQDDGKEFRLDTKEYYDHAPPNRNCESTQGGGNRCRCLYVYVFKSEQRSRG